jgi:hypothetical protein
LKRRPPIVTPSNQRLYRVLNKLQVNAPVSRKLNLFSPPFRFSKQWSRIGRGT